ncbi:glycosyltransferase family A protein [Sphaerochaeta sp. PS]|uniref:glycosyltransferase family 2 protein n=1 Tax=Sphaerochaeta sp. PS TaxID=3076336 RepID=UPI0028A560A0|nr:glycosyltransferase family A protein [Sphaerochaeta sp. PS]MDT4762159.1 glycosyltransferase family A protein [Sphaerochaeta sp. PS]
MKYSVIVPVYNAERYLKRCIDSVINQTFFDWELILVNDGSSDSSPMICDEYTKNYPGKIYTIHQNNCGVLCARRVGIAYAQGEYLCFLDSDDYWDANLLNEIDIFQVEYDSDIIVFGFRKVGFAQSKNKEELPTDQLFLYQGKDMQFIYERIVAGKMSSLWAQVVRRAIIDFSTDYTNYYHIFIGEDLLQNLAFVDKASSVLLVPNAFYNYFYNEEGLTRRKLTPLYLDSHVFVQEQLFSYAKKWIIPLDPIYQSFRNVFYKCFKSFYQDALFSPIYTKQEQRQIIVYLSSGICKTYLAHVNIVWDHKRCSLCLFLLKRGNFRMLQMVLFFFRILNMIKNAY